MAGPRTRKSAEDRKREIISAAMNLATEFGPDRVTTQHIADAVGLTQPAIFRHFPTKADIWAAVGNEIAGKLNLAQSAELDPGTKLRTVVSRQLKFIAGNPAVTAILFSRELHAENEALRAHVAAMVADRQARFSELIAQDMASGRLRADLDPADAASLILAAIQGLAMRWSLEKRQFDLVAEGERLIFGLLDSWSAGRA